MYFDCNDTSVYCTLLGHYNLHVGAYQQQTNNKKLLKRMASLVTKLSLSVSNETSKLATTTAQNMCQVLFDVLPMSAALKPYYFTDACWVIKAKSAQKSTQNKQNKDVCIRVSKKTIFQQVGQWERQDKKLASIQNVRDAERRFWNMTTASSASFLHGKQAHWCLAVSSQSRVFDNNERRTQRVF